MMDPDAVLALPARPPSEVEWEDLLVRLEIAPRALRLAVEDGPGAAHPEVRRILHMAVAWEAVLNATLDSMTRGEPLPADFGFGVEGVDADPDGLLRYVERQRRRSFAMVQRRGLEVWEWRAQGGGYPGATTYQLLQCTARLDGAVMAAIRETGREG